jgi:opacity protein-like surface antigen
MRVSLLSMLIAVVLASTAASATADTVITGSVGWTFGSGQDVPLTPNVENSHTSYGLGIGFMGDLLGFEVEATYTPHFFGDTGEGTNNVTTLMGNIVLGARLSNNLRIYASGGGGLMKFRVPSADQFFDISKNDFGVDAGAGLMIGFGGPVGVRGDVRYFRNVESNGNNVDIGFGGFHYWRGAVGLTLRF